MLYVNYISNFIFSLVGYQIFNLFDSASFQVFCHFLSHCKFDEWLVAFAHRIDVFKPNVV